ncbi:MAG: hypothetical protein ACYDAD_13600 [Acidimicrobiales bacterium]
MNETVMTEAHTDTVDPEAIAQALAVIDRNLGTLHQRELVSTSEVSDVLLDVRSILAAAHPLDPHALDTATTSPN